MMDGNLLEIKDLEVQFPIKKRHSSKNSWTHSRSG